jgi:hypothetical protein
MNGARLTVAAVVLLAAAALLVFLHSTRPRKPTPAAAAMDTLLMPSNIDAAAVAEFNSNATVSSEPLPTKFTLPTPGSFPPGRARARVGQMTGADKARFDKAFPEKVKPAVERWAKIYAGRLPFAAEDLTPDKLKDCILPDLERRTYVFVIDGTTLGVRCDPGAPVVDYMMAPAAGRLMQLGGGQMPAPPSVTRDEILALLKADSGQDFPPDQIAIHETARGTAMNGGVSVDVGKGVNSGYDMPLADFRYSIVFDPSGKLAYYERGMDYSRGLPDYEPAK